ncbi:hypothetical protein, partial [Candidatus Hakubella thermalkaliphila]|uniref:hypothetical protein n=1 Tax=Candidatus Hakubella thermalkaliphila TaxID=2754717 RepID=UPI001C613A0A
NGKPVGNLRVTSSFSLLSCGVKSATTLARKVTGASKLSVSYFTESPLQRFSPTVSSTWQC